MDSISTRSKSFFHHCYTLEDSRLEGWQRDKLGDILFSPFAPFSAGPTILSPFTNFGPPSGIGSTSSGGCLTAPLSRPPSARTSVLPENPNPVSQPRPRWIDASRVKDSV